MNVRCDLHTHTTASDGQYTPTELVGLAKKRGLSVLAVTDHDTIAGVGEAQQAGNALGLRVIRGVELSAKDHPNCHILGYGFRDGDTELARLCEKFRAGRDERKHKIVDFLREKGADEVIIRGVASHGYGLCCDIEPVSTMEKVLFTIDELSGLITAAVLMRPSRSVMDIELKSVKKKFKDKRFAAGCSREVIASGAELLGWELDKLLDMTLRAMQAEEEAIEAAVAAL